MMKYLKIYESHEETHKKFVSLYSDFEKTVKETLDKYKSTIDDFLLDISDYYEVTSKSLNVPNHAYLMVPSKEYIRYKISFNCDEYKKVISLLKEATDALKESHDIICSFTGISCRRWIGDSEEYESINNIDDIEPVITNLMRIYSDEIKLSIELTF